jgi:hypothetical protein
VGDFTRMLDHQARALGKPGLEQAALNSLSNTLFFSHGEKELNAALNLLSEYPVLVVAWKTYALLGRLRLQSGDTVSAREAFAKAAAIVNSIAAQVDDERLRTTFLNSAAAREVFATAGETRTL